MVKVTIVWVLLHAGQDYTHDRFWLTWKECEKAKLSAADDCIPVRYPSMKVIYAED